MKRFRPFILAGILLVVASLAFAVQGRQPKTGDGVTLQNASAISPIPAVSRCDTVKSSALKNYTTTGFTQIDWKATNTSGVPINVKRSLNSNSAYMPGTGGSITNDKPVPGNWSIQQIGLKTFANVTAIYCVDRQ